MADIFRKEALDRLSSPERLDQLMHVVQPKDWLVLSTFAVLVLLAVSWSVFGQLPTMVSGRGVLIRPRRVVDVQAPASGRLATLAVQVGDTITSGDLLGTLSQSDIQQQLEEAQRKLTALLAQDESKAALQEQQTALKVQQTRIEKGAIDLKGQDFRKRIRDAQAKAPVLRQRMESLTRLEERGLIARLSDERLQAEQEYLENQDKIAELQAELKQLESQRKQLDSQEKSVVLEDLEMSTARKNEIQEVQSQIALFEGQLARDSQILSNRSGRILELTVNVGQMVERGERLGSLDIEDDSGGLVGLSYFPIRSGKKIEPGMLIQIAPDTVERQRYGSLLGTVTSVSAFPVTKAGIASLVGNPEVVDTLVTNGPVIEVSAALQSDPATFSGYQWSSSQGPELPITSGTTASARVIVEQRAPITYLLPILREVSGLY